MVTIADQGTTALLSLALDATVMRQQVLAQNIANVNTPGYKRLGVNFEQRVSALMEGPGGAVRADSASLRPFVQVAGDTATGNKVELDTEVAAMSENTLRHQVLVKALSRHFAIIGAAIGEGRR